MRKDSFKHLVDQLVDMRFEFQVINLVHYDVDDFFYITEKVEKNIGEDMLVLSFPLGNGEIVVLEDDYELIAETIAILKDW